MTYDEAVKYIHSVSWLKSRPGLERIGELCRLLGDVQDTLRIIHVAGTNGKGSFCAMLSQILLEAGYSVGMFTSPYVMCFNERIQLNGEPISDEDLARVTSRVAPLADAMEDHPTEFELITAIGFSYFAEKHPDFVILEAGMGGRLDSTNIISQPLLSVITGIALDHTAYLGDTIEKIAAEKAGIIKHGGSVVIGSMPSEAAKVISTRAREEHAAFSATDCDKIGNCRYSVSGTDFVYDEKMYRLSLIGEYQTKNAACVLCAVAALRAAEINIPQTAVERGLARAVWHARFELLTNEPIIIYDGAHNPDGVRAAARNIKLFFECEPIAVMGVMADKDRDTMLDELAPLFREVYCVRPENPRSLDSATLAAEFAERGVKSADCGSVDCGVRRAIIAARETGAPIVILGSLYMYSEALCAVNRYAEKSSGLSTSNGGVLS